LGSLLEQLKSPASLITTVLTSLASTIFTIGDEYDKTEKHLTAFTGSQEKATEAIEYARRIANLLGTDIQETAQTWSSFDSTMQAIGITADRSKGFFEALSHAILSTGGSMDDVKETVEEFREGLTDGTLNGENLEQIFRDRLPRAFEASAQSMGLTNEEFSSFLNSSIDVKDILPILETGVRKAFGDIKPINNTSAAVQRLKNNFETLAAEIAKSLELSKTMTEATNTLAFSLDPKNIKAWSGAWGEHFETLKALTTGQISFDDASKRYLETANKLNGTISELGKDYGMVEDKATSAGQAQVDAANNVDPAWTKVKSGLKDLIDNFNQLEGSAGIVGQAISKVGENIDFKKPTDAVNLFTKTMEEMRTSAKLLTTDIDKGLNPVFKNLTDSQLNVLLKEVNKQLDDGKLSVENFALKTALANEQNSRLGTSTVALAQSTATLAEKDALAAAEIAKTISLRGTERDKAEANLITKEKEMKASAAKVQSLVAERNESQRQLDADIALEGGINNVSEAKRKEFQARQNTIDSKNDEIVIGLQAISQQEKEKDQLEGLTRNSNYYLTALQKIIDADTQRLQTQSSVIDSNIQRAEAEKRVAVASGDMATATDKQREIDGLQIQQAENAVEVEASRLSALQNRYQSTLSQATADGVLTEAEQQTIAALEGEIAAQEGTVAAASAAVDAVKSEISAKEKAAEASEKNAKAQSDEGKTYEKMESAAAKSVRQLHELSDGAGRLADNMLGNYKVMGSVAQSMEGMSEEAVKLSNHLKMVNEVISFNKSVVGASTDSYDDWVNAANYTWQAFDRQALAAEQMITRLEQATESGNFSLSELKTGAVEANVGIDLLDKARLDRLNAAIESANQKLREMQQEAADAKAEIESLNEEILREQGLNDEADKLALENERASKLAEVEEKINTARIENNRELITLYEEQKNKLQELYGLKEKNLETEIKSKENESKSTTTTTSNNTTTSSSSSGSSGSSGVTHTINLKAPDGTSAVIPTSDEELANRVIDVLKKSGMRIAG